MKRDDEVVCSALADNRNCRRVIRPATLLRGGAPARRRAVYAA